MCLMSGFDEFRNAINADWSFGDSVDKNICRVHVLQVEAVSDIVYSVAIAIVTKSFRCDHCVYLRLCGKSFATYVRLGADCTKQIVLVTGETNYGHRCFGEQCVVEYDRFHRSSQGRID